MWATLLATVTFATQATISASLVIRDDVISEGHGHGHGHGGHGGHAVKQRLNKLRGSRDAVDLEVFLDTSCPDCGTWVLEQLQPLWKDPEFKPLFGTSINIKVWAWQYNRDDDTTTRMNLLVNCGSKKLNNTQYIDSLICWENKLKGGSATQSQIYECLGDEDSSTRSQVLECTKDENLVAGISKSVEDNQPTALNWVPWMDVDGKRSTDAEEDFKSFICGKLADDEKPSSCAEAGKKHNAHKHGCGGEGSSPCML